MTLFVSKFAAPLAGAVLLVACGGLTGALAAPAAGERQASAAYVDFTVRVDHRGKRNVNGRPGRHYRALGPKQISRSLRQRGYQHVRIIDRRGHNYIVRAAGWRGMPVRLVVDARTAHVVRSRPLGPSFHWNLRW